MYNNENAVPQLFKSYYISNGKAVPCGERTFHYYRIDEFLRTPFPLVPSKPKAHDFRTCPGCQQVRKQIINSLQERYNKFPDCCEWHKNLKNIKEFDKNDYKDSHIQCADSIIYCYDFILNHQSTEDWQYTIKNYLKMAVFRFGCMPNGCGSALFIEAFNMQLRHMLANNNNVKDNVRCYVNEILDEMIQPADKKDPIEDLLHIYNNWLDSFPFDFPEFQPLKKKFASQSPLMTIQVTEGIHGQECYNRLVTNKELIEWLNGKSIELLRKMRELPGIIPAMILTYESSVEGKLLDIEEAKLLHRNVEEENVYLETLTNWLEIQKKRIAIMRRSVPIIDGNEAQTSYGEAYRRISKFKTWIESQDGCKFLQKIVNLKEKDLQVLFKSVCTMSDSVFRFDREVCNGRGSADFLVSKGRRDSTLIEFKLASNTSLESNLRYQDIIYMRSCEADNAIKVIFCFNEYELAKIKRLQQDMGMVDNKDIVIADCRPNKPSASKVKCDSDV